MRARRNRTLHAAGKRPGRAIIERSATSADQLLASLIRRDWDAHGAFPNCSGVDWTPVVEAALHHGVAGLLCRTLHSAPPGAVPDDMRAAAATFLDRAHAQGASLLAQMHEVLDVLEGAGIPAIPFKGPVLGLRAHGSATIRPSRDIDVLIPRADMVRGVAALAALGYVTDENIGARAMAACYESYGQDILFAKGRVPVEPHWAFGPRTFSADLDMGGFWSRSVPLDVDGRRVRSLSPEDTLLVACLHGTKEKWWRLLWLADVAAFIPRHPCLDWHALLQRATDAGILRMVLLGLALAREIFETSLPDAVARAIEADRACAGLVRASKRYLFDRTATVGSLLRVSRYHLQARERLVHRARYVWRTITTPQFPHYRMVRLPAPLFFGYVPLKLVHDYIALPLWRLGNWPRRERAARDTPELVP